MPVLPPPPSRRPDVVAWVGERLGHLSRDEPVASDIVGGQAAADTALATLDLAGYAARRNEVLPVGRRGASGLSPWIRHGLLTLPAVWAAAGAAPPRDARKFRDELLWQEYSRHVYARLGTATREPMRYEPARARRWPDPWPREMACMDATVGELHQRGWLVNQTRMWLASQWVVRAGADWRAGEDEFFAHLLDGSRAANRLGWQWTVGAGTGKPYGFSRWQVEKRAPGLCGTCALRDACPVQQWPDADPGPPVAADPRLTGTPRGGRGPEAGPSEPESTGGPDVVWLTAESLGDDDPALAAHPDLPVAFCFDEPLLARLRLSGKRLVFLAECLADLAERREVTVHLGDPVHELAGQRLATTWAPVPGWRTRSSRLEVVEVHPWPWLRTPGTGSLRSFSAWSRAAR